MAPDSERLESGILKCRKTILNQLEDKELFFFHGSKRFFDQLQKGGSSAVDNYVKLEEAGQSSKGSHP